MKGLVWIAILVGVGVIALAPAFPAVRRLLGLSEDTPDAQAVRSFLRVGSPSPVVASEKVDEHAIGLAAGIAPQDHQFSYPQQLPSTGGGFVALATDLELLEADRREFAQRNDIWSEANLLNLIGFIRERHGEFDLAIEMHRAALMLFEQIEEPLGIGDSHNNLGVVRGRIGKAREALSQHHEALKVREELGDEVRVSNSHNNLAVVLAGEKSKQAKDHLVEAMRLSRAATRDPRGMGKIINNMTVLEIETGCAQGEGELLCERFKHALELRKASEDQRGNAKTKNNLGIVFSLRGEYVAAEEQFAEAATLAGSVEDNVGLIHILRNWKHLAHTTSDSPEQLSELNQRINDISKSEALRDSALTPDCEAFPLRCGNSRIAPGQIALLSSGSATPATAAELQERLQQRDSTG